MQYSESLTCTSVASALFTFTPEPGGNGISIYPNPTLAGAATLETLQNLENATVEILDLKGVVIRSFSLPSLQERQVIDLSMIANGLYIVRIQSADFVATQRLMIRQ